MDKENIKKMVNWALKEVNSLKERVTKLEEEVRNSIDSELKDILDKFKGNEGGD